jgi:hypothetical protein
MPFPVIRIFDRETYRRVAPDRTSRSCCPTCCSRTRSGSGLRASAFDVHAHHYEELISAWPAARRCGVPIVYDAHTMLASELPAYFPGPMRPLLQRLGGALDR